jgi:hypothetical protein
LLIRRSGELQGRFDLRQFRELREGLVRSESFAHTSWGGVLQAGENRQEADLMFASDGFIEALCIDVSRYPGDDAGAVPVLFLAEWEHAVGPLRFGAIPLRSAGWMPEFRGMVGAEADRGATALVGLARLGEAARFGVPLEGDMPMLQILVRRQPGQAWARVEAELQQVLEQRLAFPAGEARVFLAPSLSVSPGGALQVQRFARLLGVTALLLAVLALLNLLTYQRVQGHELLSENALVRAMGGRARERLRLCAWEPLLVVSVACVLGLLLRLWAVDSVADFLGPAAAGLGFMHWRSLLGAGLLAGAAFGILLGYRFWLTRSAAQWAARGSRRLTRRFTGYLIAGQCLFAALALGVAVALMTEYLLSVPWSRNFRVEGIERHLMLYREPVPHPRLEALAERLIREVEVRGLGQLALSTDNYPLASAARTGLSVRAGERSIRASWTRVTAHFLPMIGLQAVAGRDFGPQDRSALSSRAPHSAIINQRLADALFGTADPLGAWIELSPDVNFANSPFSVQVIGVVDEGSGGDARPHARHALDPLVYLPLTGQDTSEVGLTMWLRPFDGVAADLATEIASLSRLVAADAWLHSSDTAQALLSQMLRRERGLAVLFGMFGMGALALGSLGGWSLLRGQRIEWQSFLALCLALGQPPRRARWQWIWRTWSPVALGVLLALPCLLLLRVLLGERWAVSAYSEALGLGLGPLVTLLAMTGFVLLEVGRAMRAERIALLKGSGETV